MPIIYKKLVSTEDFIQCVELQRDLFGLSDVDIVSPLIMQLIAREDPSMGIILGAYSIEEEKEKLVGFILTMATFQEKSIYGAIIGVKPNFRNQGLGINLFLKFREIAIRKNIDIFYGVFEPLEMKLARLYFNRLGFHGIRYQHDPSNERGKTEKGFVPSDKILLKWDLKNFSPQNENRNDFSGLLNSCPIATVNSMPDSPMVLVEIPGDFVRLLNEDVAAATYWRQNTKEIFSHYINQQKYVICDCLSAEENQIKKSYYLLKAQ